MKSDESIDPATGLPALPEGQFWRITKSDLSQYWINLSLMTWWSRNGDKKRRRPRVLVTEMVRASELCRDARGVLDRREEDRVNHEYRDSLVGDYPPKKLKAATDKKKAFRLEPPTPPLERRGGR